MRAVALRDAVAESEFGGKAASLAEALRAGLPVPPGYALDVEMVEAVRSGKPRGLAAVHTSFGALGGPIAVRSSAVGEDSADSSFAGQHLTLLNVTTVDDAVAAIRKVRDSAHSESARAYRRRRGLAEAPRVGVVFQALVSADTAGVMFTRNPVTGRDERVIEAAWGLGEAVVSGLVTPDQHRLDRGGRLIELQLGEKHVAIRPAEGGGVREVEMGAVHNDRPALSPADLFQLHRLAARCEDVYGPALDIEWVISGGRAYLLQARPITVVRTPAA